MKKSVVDRVRYLFIFAVMSFFLMACQQEAHLFYSVDEGDNIVLCFSSRPLCKGDGVYKHIIVVNKIDSDGKIGKTVWRITREKGGGEIKYLKWGDVPDGWIQDMPADKLENGGFYFVEGIYFKYVVVNGIPSLVVYDYFPTGAL